MFHWRLENLGRLRVAEAGGGRREVAFVDIGRKVACGYKQFRDDCYGLEMNVDLELGCIFANGISGCGISSHARISLRLRNHAARADGFYRENNGKAGCHAAQYGRGHCWEKGCVRAWCLCACVRACPGPSACSNGTGPDASCRNDWMKFHRLQWRFDLHVEIWPLIKTIVDMRR